MSVFVDTSALLAVLDADDRFHPSARAVWYELLDGEFGLVTTNYVVVETFALVGRRLDMAAVRTLDEDVLPVVAIEWTGEAEHRAAVTALLTAGRRDLSLVDCVSFAAMRRLDIRQAFAFDADFEDQGFEVLTGPEPGAAPGV